MSDDQTCLGQRCGPHLSSGGRVDGADVGEVATLSQPLQLTLHEVQPLLVGRFPRRVFEFLRRRGRIGGPVDVRGGIDVGRGALELLVAAQTSDLEIHRADRGWKRRVTFKGFSSMPLFSSGLI